MSPELIDPQRFGFKKGCPTKSSDCYALGMVIYEIISGSLPFHEYADLAVFMKVSKGEIPPRGARFTRSLWKVLGLCWASHTNNRPSIKGVLQGLEVASNLSEPPSPGVGEEMGNDSGSWRTADDSLGVDEETESNWGEADADFTAHSVQSPIAVPVPPKRYVDEDRVVDVAEELMNLASYRTHVPTSQPPPPPVQGTSGRASPRSMNSHHSSKSSSRGGRVSPILTTGLIQKRLHSPELEDNGGGETKRPKFSSPGSSYGNGFDGQGTPKVGNIQQTPGRLFYPFFPEKSLTPLEAPGTVLENPVWDLPVEEDKGITIRCWQALR